MVRCRHGPLPAGNLAPMPDDTRRNPRWQLGGPHSLTDTAS
jgi:hypothetical protein